MMIYLVLIVLIAFTALAYCSLLTLKVYRAVYELTHPVRYKSHNYSQIPYAYKKFEIITRDGIKLSGVDYQPKTACKGTILACHFLGGSKEAVIMFVDSLLMNGFRVLCFDNRNHGESDTDKGVKAFLQTDFDAFYKKVKSMGIEGPFGVMGFSMGAYQVLWAMNKYKDITAAIIDSGPLIYVKKYFTYVLDNKKVKNPIYRAIFLLFFLYYAGFLKISRNTIKLLKELKGKPVFIIHGEKDNIIAVDNAKLAYGLLRSNEASIWLVPHSRHLTNKFLRPNEYDERIVKFFNQNIAEKNHEKGGIDLS